VTKQKAFVSWRKQEVSCHTLLKLLKNNLLVRTASFNCRNALTVSVSLEEYSFEWWVSDQAINERLNHQRRDVTRGVQGERDSPGAESLWRSQITAGAPKSHSNVTSTFFNAVHLLPKDLSFGHGAPHLLLDPGAI